MEVWIPTHSRFGMPASTYLAKLRYVQDGSWIFLQPRYLLTTRVFRFPLACPPGLLDVRSQDLLRRYFGEAT
eukprot:2384771-Pyramimonas_sp.AAC.1